MPRTPAEEVSRTVAHFKCPVKFSSVGIPWISSSKLKFKCSSYWITQHGKDINVFWTDNGLMHHWHHTIFLGLTIDDNYWSLLCVWGGILTKDVLKVGYINCKSTSFTAHTPVSMELKSLSSFDMYAYHLIYAQVTWQCALPDVFNHFYSILQFSKFNTLNRQSLVHPYSSRPTKHNQNKNSQLTGGRCPCSSGI